MKTRNANRTKQIRKRKEKKHIRREIKKRRILW